MSIRFSPHDLRVMFSTRNPATLNIFQHFCDNHLHVDLLPIAQAHRQLAIDMLVRLPDGTELIRGLRKLLDAREAFIRHHLASHNFILSTPHSIFKPVDQNGENQT